MWIRARSLVAGACLGFGASVLANQVSLNVGLAAIVLGLSLASYDLWPFDTVIKKMLGALGIAFMGTIAVFLMLPFFWSPMRPCPPSQVNYTGRYQVLILQPGSSEIARFSKTYFHPPGETQAIAVQVSVSQGAIVWSDDNEETSHKVAKGDPSFWVCRDKIPRFTAKQDNPEGAVIGANYVW